MRFLRSAAYLTVATFCLLQAIGCMKSEGPVQGEDTLEAIINRGELRAAYFIQPPAVMKDPNTGELSGSFVDAARFIANEIGVKIAFVEVDLAQFAAGLGTRYDLSVGPTFRTITRAKAVAFTDTIFYLGYTGVVKKGRATEFKSYSDLDRLGITVAVKEGSAIAQYVRGNPFKNARTISLSGTDLTLPLQAVSSGQADVGLMNEHTVEFYARSHPEVEVILANKPVQTVGMSWAVHPNDHRWLHFLNTSLEYLTSTGKMAEWERRYYFGRTLHRQLIEPEIPTVR